MGSCVLRGGDDPQARGSSAVCSARFSIYLSIYRISSSTVLTYTVCASLPR